MKKIAIVAVLVLGGAGLYAQARNALNLIVNGPDANGNLPVGVLAYGGQVGPARTLANLLLKADTNGNLAVTMPNGLPAVTTVNGVTLDTTNTTMGVVGVVKAAESTGNTAAVTNAINYTPPAASHTFRIAGVVNVTAWTTPASFTVQATYKDASGNARTDTATVSRGSTGATAAAVTAIDRWYFELPGVDVDNSATAITLSTAGTFTGSPVYNLAATLELLR